MNDGDGDAKFCEAEEERLACLRKKDVAGVRLAEIKILANLMTAQYGNAVIDEKEGTVTVHVPFALLRPTDDDNGFCQVNDEDVVIEGMSGKMQCSNPAVRSRIEQSLERLRRALAPIPIQ